MAKMSRHKKIYFRHAMRYRIRKKDKFIDKLPGTGKPNSELSKRISLISYLGNGWNWGHFFMAQDDNMFIMFPLVT